MKKHRKWFVLGILIVFSYLSSFVPNKVNEALLFHNLTSDVSVQGSKDQTYQASQIKELEIGVEKVDLTIQTQEDGETPLRQGFEGQGEGRAQQTTVVTLTPTTPIVQDAKNGSAQEILSALNNYRQARGKGTLVWDQKLADFAQSRASYFSSRGDLDNHAGFTDFVNNQNGFNALGFMGLGENSSYGYTLDGVSLIEQVYAGHKTHDDNQLNSEWTHVGIGVSGTATNLIFGGKKL